MNLAGKEHFRVSSDDTRADGQKWTEVAIEEVDSIKPLGNKEVLVVLKNSRTIRFNGEVRIVA